MCKNTSRFSLFLLWLLQIQCKAQQRIEEYRIDYSKCNPTGIRRVWLNDSTFTEQGLTDSRRDTFLIEKSGLYYMRKGEKFEFLSSQSFSKKDTVTMYGKEYIKSTHLLPISDIYIPDRKDTIFGTEVLVYKVADPYRHADYSYDEVYFDPKTFLILKHKTLECGEGILKKLNN